MNKGISSESGTGTSLLKQICSPAFLMPLGIKFYLFLIICPLPIWALNCDLKLLNSSIYSWFANYLVVKEPLLNQLPSIPCKCLNVFGDERLIDAVLETFNTIETLLKSPKTAGSSSDRTLLKTLGMWLGALTLARDRPILHNYLSIKIFWLMPSFQILVSFVIPFACKVFGTNNV